MSIAIKKIWHGRFPSREINIGEIALGGKNPLRIQSMTNTNTLDVEATTKQSVSMIEAGADFVRISAPNIKSAENLAEIKNNIRKAGYNTPVIADIHYNPDVAIIAAKIAEKIRINPGNYGSRASFSKKQFLESDKDRELEMIQKNLSPLLKVCREHGTVIRIGTNHGSLSPRILYHHGNTAEGMVQATLEYLKIFENNSFQNIVISLKSSNPNVMIEAYRQIAYEMIKNDMCYPLHLGVTEAGAHDEGRIRSALGICTLLSDGIGDTIRVSLSEKPENEISFAKRIVKTYQNDCLKYKEDILSCSEAEKFCILKNIRNNLPAKNFKQPVVISASDEYPRSEEKQDYLQPDYIFTVKQPDEKIKKYIFPFNIWKKLNCNDETYPLLNINELENIKNVNADIIFIYINTDDVFKKEIKSIYLPETAVIILETENNPCLNQIISIINYLQKLWKVPLIIKSTLNTTDGEQAIIDISRLHGYLVSEGIINGLWIDSHAETKNQSGTKLSYSILQATEKRITTNQYISCPTCARTSFDLEKIIKDVKENTQRFKGLKIAVMGCVVNGPGEMADADYGLVGAGNNKIHIYKKQQIIRKNVDQNQATGELVRLIEKHETLCNSQKH